MIVGIDLGTTHSLIGAYTEQGSKLFPNALGGLLTPSVVSVDGDTVLVGQAARDRLISHPDRTVAAFKRWMGSSRETRLGDRSFRPEELSALVLRSLLADAEAAMGGKITEAVISVPAYFSDAQRKATRSAGELAGVRVERLINEPTAAALAYGLQNREQESRFLVFDLGGGTFDVSILESFGSVFEVHATAGDNFLGGGDFLDVLVEAFCQDHALRRQAMSAQEYGQLRRRMEVLKREIGGTAVPPLQIAIGDNSYTWSIEEDRFARLCEPLVQRMRAPIERAMRDAKLQPAQLGEIVVVGGAGRVPLGAGDGGEQLLGLEGLGEHGGGAELEGALDVAFAVVGGDDDERGAGVAGVLADGVDELEAVDVRHVDVGDHEVVVGARHQAQGVEAVADLIDDVVAGRLEHGAHEGAHGGGVLDEKYPDRHRRAVYAGL